MLVTMQTNPIAGQRVFIRVFLLEVHGRLGRLIFYTIVDLREINFLAINFT